jgi:hypothetical protein
MKKILFFALLAFGINAKAQITLEHTYDSASTAGGSGFIQSQLVYLNLEVSGEKYININKTGKYISVYNLNHSLTKVISYANFPQACNGIATFLYFSENLFDNDDMMEFMYTWTDCSNPIHTRIYKEDGTCIFSVDSMAAFVNINVQQLQYPIFNTSQGTKMILSQQYNGTAKIYSLPGILTTAIADANNNIITMQGSVSNAYPNPTNNSTQINYSLPDSVDFGEIVFYDLTGNEVKRFKVDKTFDTLLISTSDINAGTYFYQLQTTGQNSDGKKLIVIK